MLQIERVLAKRYLERQLAEDPNAAKPLSRSEARELERLELIHGHNPVSPVRWAARGELTELRRERIAAAGRDRRDYWRAYWDNQRRRFR